MEETLKPPHDESNDYGIDYSRCKHIKEIMRMSDRREEMIFVRDIAVAVINEDMIK